MSDTDEGLDATYYEDADGDMYGDPDSTPTACEAPSGTVDNDLDCLDTDASVNPSLAAADATPRTSQQPASPGFFSAGFPPDPATAASSSSGSRPVLRLASIRPTSVSPLIHSSN